MVREERFITDQEAQEFNFKAGQGSQTGGEGLLGFPCNGIQEQDMKAEGFHVEGVVRSTSGLAFYSTTPKTSRP